MTRAIDTLATLARDAEPPPLDDTTARRMIDHALRAAPAFAPATRRSYALAAVVAVAAVATVVAAVWLSRGEVPAPSIAEVSHVELPTGDRLTGTDSARFDLAHVEPAHRRVHLQRGTLLADVAPLVPGQRFEIVTAHLLATAKGTVFSVETDALRSRVRVYEGVVEVTQDGASQLIRAGGMWVSDVHALAIMTERPAALAADIDEAVGRRAVVSQVPAPSAELVPHPDPAPTLVPPPVPEPARVARPAEPSLDELHARALAELAAGKLESALATAKLAATLGPPTGAWHLVAADALRGLGRPREAADAFLAAAKDLTGADAVEAGYSAAYLLLKDVRDPERALTALVSTRVAAPDSPLEERGLVLHVRILEALGRDAEAKPVAERYLERFPHGDERMRMLRLAK